MVAGLTFQILFLEPPLYIKTEHFDFLRIMVMNLKILPDIRKRFVTVFNTRLAPLVALC
jgi:hypothetical protein